MASKTKGHWPAGKSRIADGIYAGEFITALHDTEQLSFYQIGKLLGVSCRQVVRVARGQQRVSQAAIESLIDTLWPGVWSRQARLSGDGDIGPTTWTAGVGEYTRRSARCGPCG